LRSIIVLSNAVFVIFLTGYWLNHSLNHSLADEMFMCCAIHLRRTKCT